MPNEMGSWPDQDPQQLQLPTVLPRLPLGGQQISTPITKNIYTIGEFIGEGSFGYVYACTDLWNNELAAKILKPDGDRQLVQGNAIREYQRLFALRHTYITYVFDMFEFQELSYIITERCWWSVTRLINELAGFNGAVWLMPIARCILQAVDFIHSNGVVHKDIHPGNVFVNAQKSELVTDGRVNFNFKLGDLGISALVSELQPGHGPFANWIFPPEVMDPVQFGPIDHRVDLYHCGLLLLQILSGKLLKFSHNDILAGVPRQLALQLPMPFSAAIEKTLRRHTMFRTESAKELWRDLNSPVA